MKNIYELIQNDLLVREPIDDVCKKITKTSDKIILTGGRGIGKTIILSNLEAKGLGTENQYISTRFDAAGFGDDYKSIFITHYYELEMALELLNYVKKNYSLTYNKYFKDLELQISGHLVNAINYRRNHIYANVTINKYFKTGELCFEIIQKIKQVLNIDSLNITIDRFDWTNSVNPITQQLLSEYFKLFDKTIITSDDETLESKQDFSIIKLDYGKDVEVVKEILKKQILNLSKNKSNFEKFPINNIPDYVYNNLIEKTNGNIEMMLEILKDVISYWEWDKKGFSASQVFKGATNEKVRSFEQIKKIGKSPKLYI